MAKKKTDERERAAFYGTDEELRAHCARIRRETEKAIAVRAAERADDIEKFHRERAAHARRMTELGEWP